MNPTQRLGTGRSSTFVDRAALEFIKKITLVGDQTDVTFNDLDGDADVLYYLDYSVKVGSGGLTSEFSLRPNGETTNLSGTFVQSSGSGTASATRAFMLIGVVDATDGVCVGGLWLRALSGKYRFGFGQFLRSNDPDSILYVINESIRWKNTVDNITSLVIHSETEVNGFGAGSELSLYKMRNS